MSRTSLDRRSRARTPHGLWADITLHNRRQGLPSKARMVQTCAYRYARRYPHLVRTWRQYEALLERILSRSGWGEFPATRGSLAPALYAPGHRFRGAGMPRPNGPVRADHSFQEVRYWVREWDLQPRRDRWFKYLKQAQQARVQAAETAYQRGLQRTRAKRVELLDTAKDIRKAIRAAEAAMKGRTA